VGGDRGCAVWVRGSDLCRSDGSAVCWVGVAGMPGLQTVDAWSSWFLTAVSAWVAVSMAVGVAFAFIVEVF
jgi:hypothetical protein